MSFINMLLVITDPNFFLKRPKSARLDVWRLPGFEARAKVVLGVHRSAFAQQQLRSRDKAVACHQVQRGEASGGFSPESRRGRCGLPSKTTGRRGRCAVGGRKWWVMLTSITRSTDKGTMDVLDFKQNTFIYKHSRHLFYNWILQHYILLK